MLTAEMRAIIESYPLGFVASVNDDGTPNLSPKGTFVVLDDAHLAFGNIRSPGTLANIAKRPKVEINFLDVLARKAVRVAGAAHIVRKSDAEFGSLFARMAQWEGYTQLMSALVRIDISRAQLILSPAYDIGHTEAELRAQYRARFSA
jgi:predicted pyridoxine 5'-phosphate oxidase superfamily flavin-nucleotide-binding protein